MALAESFLQDITHHSMKEVNACLNKAQECADLMKTNKKYYVLFLRAIYFYYKGDKEKSVDYFTKCSELLVHSNYMSKMKILLEQTETNKEVVLNHYTTDNEIHLTSQIITQDGIFNLICL